MMQLGEGCSSDWSGMKARLPWLYHIRVWPKASLEAKTSPCPADWKIAPVGWLALFISTAVNTQMTQGWAHVWLICQGPRQSLLGLGLCLQHRGQGTPAPLRVDLRMLVPPQLLPFIPVEVLVSMFGGCLQEGVFFLGPGHPLPTS